MTNFISLLRKSVLNLDRSTAILLIAWLAVMISLPLLDLIFGVQTLLQTLALAVLLQATLVLRVMYQAWGWWSILRVASAVVILAWAVQAIIIRSGLPYGNLTYTTSLQPQVLGVPILIPITWMMMLPSAWAIAKLITRKLSGCLMRLSFVMISALALTAWGLYFDPLMAHFGVLQWYPTGNYAGIPWQHFIGWLIVSGVFTFAIGPKRLPGGLLVLVYALTGLVEFISLLIYGGLLVPALIGCGLMGGMLVWAGVVTQ